MTHLQNKWFALNFKFQRNASKFAIFIIKRKPIYLVFSHFILLLMNAGHSYCEKLKLLETKKSLKLNGFSFLVLRNSQFWSIYLEFDRERKSFILEVWGHDIHEMHKMLLHILKEKPFKIFYDNWLWHRVFVTLQCQMTTTFPISRRSSNTATGRARNVWWFFLTSLLGRSRLKRVCCSSDLSLLGAILNPLPWKSPWWMRSLIHKYFYRAFT